MKQEKMCPKNSIKDSSPMDSSFPLWTFPPWDSSTADNSAASLYKNNFQNIKLELKNSFALEMKLFWSFFISIQHTCYKENK